MLVIQPHGLVDWHSKKSCNAALTVRIKHDEGYLEKVRDYIDNNCIDNELKDNLTHQKLTDVKKDLQLWIRMFYSCLVDADFLGTEGYMDLSKSLKRSKFNSIPEPVKKNFDYMKNKI